MYVVTITPPEPLVELDLAKRHLRVDHDDDDLLISAYIAAASAHIDGPGGWLGQAIGPQTLEARFDRFGCDLLPLPYQPLLTIESVTYDDNDGVGQEVVAADYTLEPSGVLLAYGASWPAARQRAGSVRVEYTAGYSEIPASITAAVLLMVGDLYANRETVAGGSSSKLAMSTTVEALLAPYRVWAV